MSPTQKNQLIHPEYALWIRNLLEKGEQKQIAEQLKLQYEYVKQVLGGNRNKTIKSTKAIAVIELAEQLVRLRHEQKMQEAQGIIKALNEKASQKSPSSLLLGAESASIIPLFDTQKELYDFIYIITHDLRSPLRSIESLLNFVLEERDNEQAFSILQQVSKNIASTSGLLENLLEWVQNALQLQENTFNGSLLESIEQAYTYLKEVFEAKDIQLEIAITEDSTLPLPGHALYFVLRNLFHNAIKFSNPSSKIKVFSQLSTNVTFIYVRDEGKGIESKQLKHLFDFTKAHSDQGTSQEKGSGIGLGLCKRVLQRHGCDIFCQSNAPDAGSTFVIRIPQQR
ncbi:MAG: HAMP domain-containing histidine kinase [Saprospiraceae bacterium]|nr:HAMP domain-containing histidine kinase [Saprospiraceae bacterium]